jgi:serine/threonine protein kinase
MHRDLKPHNILLNPSTGVIKIADLGMTREGDITHTRAFTRQVQTLWYRSPEVLLGDVMYTSAVDIWSAGCILSQLITGHTLFPGESEIEQLFKIFAVIGTPTEKKWGGVTKLEDYDNGFPQWRTASWDKLKHWPADQKDALHLLKQLLKMNPSERISASEALLHVYFNEDVRK